MEHDPFIDDDDDDDNNDNYFPISNGLEGHVTGKPHDLHGKFMENSG